MYYQNLAEFFLALPFNDEMPEGTVESRKAFLASC